MQGFPRIQVPRLALSPKWVVASEGLPADESEVKSHYPSWSPAFFIFQISVDTGGLGNSCYLCAARSSLKRFNTAGASVDSLANALKPPNL